MNVVKMNILTEGMQVVCVWPVNGLRYGGLYTITRVQRREFMGTDTILVRDVADGLIPQGGGHGYFPWRFEHPVLR